MPDQPVKRSERLDPTVAALLTMMDAQAGPPLEEQDPVEAREQRMGPMKMLGGELEPLARIEDLDIPGPGGPIPIRVYSSHADKTQLRPGLMYFHGGGYVFGNLDTHDPLCRALAKAADTVIVAVDYRLAPEHKFPAAVDDCHAATLWTAAHAESLGIEAQRIMVGGDSAGGSLATVVSMRCRDSGGPAIAAQLMLYPVTNVSSFDTGSYRELSEGYFLTASSMQWFMSHYLVSAGQATLPEVSPLLADDLRGLPPALVITAEFDPLRDEGEAYARRLEQAGLQVTAVRYPGVIHGFISMRGVVPAGQTAIEAIGEYIRSVGSASAAA